MRRTKHTPEQIREALGHDRLPSLEIAARLGLRAWEAPKIFPLLARMEATGELCSEWQNPDGEKPRRRLYFVNPKAA